MYRHLSEYGAAFELNLQFAQLYLVFNLNKASISLYFNLSNFKR